MLVPGIWVGPITLTLIVPYGADRDLSFSVASERLVPSHLMVFPELKSKTMSIPAPPCLPWTLQRRWQPGRAVPWELQPCPHPSAGSLVELAKLQGEKAGPEETEEEGTVRPSLARVGVFTRTRTFCFKTGTGAGKLGQISHPR